MGEMSPVPAALCQQILADSGLADHYKEENQRIANLHRFVQFFQDHDDPARPPAELLADLTRRSAQPQARLNLV